MKPVKNQPPGAFKIIQVEIEIDRAYFRQFSQKREANIDGVVVFWGRPCQTFFVHAN